MNHIYLVHVGTAAEDRSVAAACASEELAEAYKKVFLERQNEEVSIERMEIEHSLPEGRWVWTCRSSPDEARTVVFVALDAGGVSRRPVSKAIDGTLYVSVIAETLMEASQQAEALFKEFQG